MIRRVPAALLITLTWGLLLGAFASGGVADGAQGFQAALKRAERAIENEQWGDADASAVRALERDPENAKAWAVRARAAAGAEDVDLQIHCLHKEYRFLEAQGASRKELEPKRKALLALDPVAARLFELRDSFSKKLTAVAEGYEKAERPHGAIRVWKEVIALDPESAVAAAAIERIAAEPDPSLAADAKPKDLFADVSDEWIAEHDAEHGEWKEAATLKRVHYDTVTNAGYEVLVRTAEAMEQMAAFYQRFFRYGADGDKRSAPRIKVHVFASRDEYLELGIGPPVEWSAGHFTGSHVECYIGEGGFGGMVGTLFHEAAHQYVSLATNAQGWLNEGLASFFEGTRILPNGAIVMNEPADHRLMPLAGRMDKGWMEHPQDTDDPNDPNSMPETAPSWRMIVENAYSWGPPWYAPTWGVVYFCYNFQHPVDGRFVYRDVFMDFVDASGGKTGKTAVKTFEEVVLAQPKAPYKGLDGKPIESSTAFQLPKDIDALNDVWKEWILALRDERIGRTEVARPYGDWARLAAANGDFLIAREHYEKGIQSAPDDVQLGFDFARLLDEEFDESDRAARIVEDALRMLEAEEVPDAEEIAAAERLLTKLDPKRRTLTRTREELQAAAVALVEAYKEAERPAMVQDIAWRFGSEFGLTELFEDYADAVTARGEDLTIWDLAYNEDNLDGWTASTPIFEPAGANLVAKGEPFDLGNFDFKYLTLDRVTGGDMSIVAELQAEPGKSAFAGFVFGVKGANAFHSALYFPPREGAEGTATTAFLDLMTSYGGGATKAWRHAPIPAPVVEGRSSTGEWHTVRLDITGATVDVWWDGDLAASHTFVSRDLLLGSFGLVTGTGTAKFRNIRFRSRDATSPAGRIERRLRLAKTGRDAGVPVDGSYQGLVPPFPETKRWLQGERENYAEAGAVPQLLVFWSKAQNSLVPIDGWLNSFAKEWESVGLRVIAIAAAEDEEGLKAYLEEHPLPGSVGLDLRPPEVFGVGNSFKAFSILRFNLPRVLLIDVDGTVAWEGDPGFSSNDPPAPPYPSYVDTPMEDLASKRRLLEVAKWRASFGAEANDALLEGRIDVVLPLLQEARSLGDVPFVDVRRAAAKLDALQAAVEDPTELIAAAEAAGAGPALAPLKEWAEAMEMPLPKKRAKALAAAQKGKVQKDWTKALKAAKKAAASKKDEGEVLGALREDLKELTGALPAALLDELDARGLDAARGAENLPAAYLARNLLGW